MLLNVPELVLPHWAKEAAAKEASAQSAKVDDKDGSTAPNKVDLEVRVYSGEKDDNHQGAPQQVDVHDDGREDRGSNNDYIGSQQAEMRDGLPDNFFEPVEDMKGPLKGW